MFIACTKHSDKNFLGISSCDTLSNPLRQAWLVLTDENIWGSESRSSLPNYQESAAAAAAASAAKSLQSCLTLCDPIDGRPPGSSVLGILQARVLEWVAIAFSNQESAGVTKKMSEQVSQMRNPDALATHSGIKKWLITNSV